MVNLKLKLQGCEYPARQGMVNLKLKLQGGGYKPDEEQYI
jgi:hypothetical protein